MKHIKDFFEQDNTRQKFTDILGTRAAAFIAAFLQVVEQRTALQIADLQSLYNAAIAAATIDLPLNAGLNYAYISSDTDERTGIVMASYNVGWKGYVQLALRSEKYRTINVTDVREGEIKKQDRLSGELEFKWEQSEAKRKTLPVIGYVAYYSLLSGFTKSNYRTIEDIKAHGQKYSKEYAVAGGKWDANFEAMAAKTVLKELLAKYGLLSTVMEIAIRADQAVIKEITEHTLTTEYKDNPLAEPASPQQRKEPKKSAANAKKSESQVIAKLQNRKPAAKK
jgi:recombination protein RecT